MTFCIWLSLAQCFQDSSRWKCVDHYFTPFHCRIIFRCMGVPLLFVHSSVDGFGGCFYLLLLWLMQLPIFVYKFLSGHKFSIIWSLYLGVEFLGHMVTLCLITWRLVDCFSKMTTPFTLPPAMREGSDFSISSPTLVIIWLEPFSWIWGSFDLHFLDDE